MAKRPSIRKGHEYYNGKGAKPCKIKCEECGAERQLTELLPGPCYKCQNETARVI